MARCKGASQPATSISAYQGLKEYVSSKGYDINVTAGNTADAASNADLAVVVVGLDAADEGEEYSLPSWGDRVTLDLPDNQAQFVRDVLAYGKPTVIIIQSGTIVNVPWLTDPDHTKQATIWAGYGGSRQGAAYAKLPFGEANFGGKMAVTWPKQVDLLEFHDDAFSHTQDYWFGYRYYDHLNKSGNLVFPFGWGMSYTTFGYSNLALPCGSIAKDGVIKITVDVENTGPYDGDEIVQMYVKGPQNPAGIVGKRPVKELKGFQRVNGLKAAGQAGSVVRVTLPLAIQELRHWEGDLAGRWVVDSGEYTIMVGPNAADLQLTGKLTVHD